MRVSKETAILLKDAGYDVPCNLVPNSCIVDDSGNILYLPTLHEAADWLRSKGVHVYTVFSGKKGWLYGVSTFDCSVFGISKDYHPTYESAYEAGIVHGLKYLQ